MRQSEAGLVSHPFMCRLSLERNPRESLIWAKKIEPELLCSCQKSGGLHMKGTSIENIARDPTIYGMGQKKVPKKTYHS